MTLTDLLGRFAEVVEERDGWVAVCPHHADSHPSLRVAVSDRGKVLLRCRAGCDTADVLRDLGLTFGDLPTVDPADVPTHLATSTATPASPEHVARLAAQLDRYAADLRRLDQTAEDALRYTHDRFGLDSDASYRLGLGVATDLGGGPRVVVPFRDRDGVPRGYQARSLVRDAKVRWLGARSPDGASWSKIAWLPGDSGWPEVVVTEGPGDGLTACAVGYDVIAVRGAGLGTTVAPEVAEWAAGRPVIVAADADRSGDEFARQLAAGLAGHGLSVRRVRPPTDGDDLTDWRERDPDTFSTDFIRAVTAATDPGGLNTRADAWQDSDLTDVAAARRLLQHFQDRGSGVRYSLEVGFFLLDGGVWRPDKLDAVRTHAQELARSIWDEVEALSEAVDAVEAAGDPDGEASRLKRRVGKMKVFAKHANSSKGLDYMLRELQALPGVAADVNDFDKHPHLLACRNGVVNLRTGKLQPHDPGLLLTRRVDIAYDPDATAPRWEQFLREVFPDPRAHAGLPDYVRRLVGYGITGETSEQCFAVLWGTGANGKSVFTDTLTEVFRELTVTTPFSTFEERPSGGIPNDLASLKGARLVMAAEGEQGRPMAEAVLKRVTGRDLISARFMRKEFFEFRPTFLLLLATNFKPQFRGQDEGLWRRVKLIPWERWFAPHERDHQLGQALLGEAPGIFAWAVRGASEWYRNGLQDPTAIVSATGEYRQASDVLNGFLPGVFVADPNAKVEAKSVFTAFQTYADEGNYLDLKKWSNRALYRALEERGYPRRRSTGGKFVVVGIRRARQTDAVPDHADPEPDDDGTAPGPVAHTPTDTTHMTGASLDDVLGTGD